MCMKDLSDVQRCNCPNWAVWTQTTASKRQNDILVDIQGKLGAQRRVLRHLRLCPTGGRWSFLSADVTQLCCVPFLLIKLHLLQRQNVLYTREENLLQGCLPLKSVFKNVCERMYQPPLVCVCVCVAVSVSVSWINSELLMSDISRSLSNENTSLPPAPSLPLFPRFSPTFLFLPLTVSEVGMKERTG